MESGSTGAGLGWVYGVGIRVGNTGGYTGYPATCPRRVPDTAKRAPEALEGWSGWYLGLGRTGGGVGPCTHPSGARSALQASLVQDPADSRLTANKGEIPLHFQ